MTGPEHYREAQRLLANSKAVIETASPNTIDDALKAADAAVVAAQVHATLALAAAHALGTCGLPVDGETAQEWRGTIARPKSATTPTSPPPLSDYECCASGSCEVCRA